MPLGSAFHEEKDTTEEGILPETGKAPSEWETNLSFF
jgi:hypothetical protein